VTAFTSLLLLRPATFLGYRCSGNLAGSFAVRATEPGTVADQHVCTGWKREGEEESGVLFLPFSLPTSTDMLVSYGAGFGGTNRERARKYIPEPGTVADQHVCTGWKREGEEESGVEEDTITGT
jgi:hypothetical protein